nr:hypothetical protein [Tanacetum cinerariifolium]
IVQTSQHPEWFSQPRKPPSPDRDWNTALPAAQGDAQSWISDLAKQADARSSFNELFDTPIDFSNFIMHRLNVDTLIADLLAGPTYELMRGSCSSLTELEYHLEEIYKATTDQLDWVNPEGQQYPHNLLQPLSLIPDNRGRRQPIDYNKYALWGVSHWGRKRKQFYGYAVNRESARDVYSKRRIIAIYKFKEGNFKRLRLQDIKDMRIDELHKFSDGTLNDVRNALDDRYSNPRGFIYQNKDKKNILMRIDELHKFSDGTLNDVRNALDDRLKEIRMQYLPSTIWRKDKDRAAAMIQAIEKC